MAEFKNKKQCINSKYSKEELLSIAANLGIMVKSSATKSDVCSSIEKYTKKILKDTKDQAKLKEKEAKMAKKLKQKEEEALFKVFRRYMTNLSLGIVNMSWPEYARRVGVVLTKEDLENPKFDVENYGWNGRLQML